MSRRMILSLIASFVFGVGFLLTVSTDASAQRRAAGVYRGGGGAVVVRPGYRGRYYRPGVAAGAAALGAAAVVGAAAAGAYYAPGYYGPGYYGPGPGVYVAPQCGYYPYPPCY